VTTEETAEKNPSNEMSRFVKSQVTRNHRPMQTFLRLLMVNA